MTDTPKSVTITNREMWIDGEKFPWLMAEEGPTIEVREDYGELRVVVLHVPILVVEEREKALAGQLAPQLSGAPVVDLRTRSKVKLEEVKVRGGSYRRIKVTPGKGGHARYWHIDRWAEAMDYATRDAR